jgi:hypothetical protein
LHKGVTPRLVMIGPPARSFHGVLRHLSFAVGLFLAGCGAAQVTAAPLRVTGVAASCAALSPAQQLAAARLVFVGVTLPGPTTRLGGRRVLGSPARLRVERYLKGHGPRTALVDTAVRIGAHGVTVAEDGIAPSPGQRWKIYTSSRRQPFQTSICGGSRRRPGRVSAHSSRRPR